MCSPTAKRAHGPEGPRLVALVSQLDAIMRSTLDRALRPLGLTSLRFFALDMVERVGPMASAEIGSRTGSSPQASQDLIRDLVGRGLVTRERRDTDRRRLTVAVTARGRQALLDAHEVARQVEEQIFIDLDDGEHTALVRALRKARTDPFEVRRTDDS